MFYIHLARENKCDLSLLFSLYCAHTRSKFYFYSEWMGTKMEIGGEAMHLRSRDLCYEGHAALCAKRRPPLATPPLLEIANVKLATLSHWQHSQPPALRQSKSRYLANSSITPLNFTLFLRYHPRSSKPRNTLSTRNGCEPIIAAKDAKSAKAVEPFKKKLCVRKRTSREAKRFAPYSTRFCTFYTAKNLIGFSCV